MDQDGSAWQIRVAVPFHWPATTGASSAPVLHRRASNRSDSAAGFGGYLRPGLPWYDSRGPVAALPVHGHPITGAELRKHRAMYAQFHQRMVVFQNRGYDSGDCIA